MSGGSYNYLHQIWDLNDAYAKRGCLEEMADRLSGLPELDFPGAAAAAERTRALHAVLSLWDEHVTAQVQLLGDVWHAVEWWDSADSGPDGVVEALTKMLAPDPAAPARLPFAVVRETSRLGYFGQCRMCTARTQTWFGEDSLAVATEWGQVHREECPKRCPELVPAGGGVRCDRYVDHPMEGQFGGHGWGAGPFTTRISR